MLTVGRGDAGTSSRFFYFSLVFYSIGNKILIGLIYYEFIVLFISLISKLVV
jgi:hypothetical protein